MLEKHEERLSSSTYATGGARETTTRKAVRRQVRETAAPVHFADLHAYLLLGAHGTFVVTVTHPSFCSLQHTSPPHPK